MEKKQKYTMNQFDENADGSVTVYLDKAISDEYVSVKLMAGGKEIEGVQKVTFTPASLEVLKKIMNKDKKS